MGALRHMLWSYFYVFVPWSCCTTSGALCNVLLLDLLWCTIARAKKSNLVCRESFLLSFLYNSVYNCIIIQALHCAYLRVEWPLLTMPIIIVCCLQLFGPWKYVRRNRNCTKVLATLKSLKKKVVRVFSRNLKSSSNFHPLRRKPNQGMVSK